MPRTPLDELRKWISGWFRQKTDPVVSVRYVCFPQSEVDDIPLSATDRDLLLVTGLPDSTPPFLSFGGDEDCLLARGDEVGKYPAEFGRYRIIGGTGYGDDICIDSTNGQVVFIDHDFNLQVRFINSSVTALAACLAAFERYVGHMDAQHCRAEMFAVDPAVLSDDGFWQQAIEDYGAQD